MAKSLTATFPMEVDTVEVLRNSLVDGLRRVDRDLATYADFLGQNAAASDELKQDLQDTCQAIAALELRVFRLSTQRQANRLDVHTFLAEVQRLQETARGQKKQVNLDTGLSAPRQSRPSIVVPVLSIVLAVAALFFASYCCKACDVVPQPEVGSLYQRRATQRRIQPIGDTVECVNRCGNLACHKNDDEQTASCEDCQFVFCVNCSSPAHPEEPDCIKYLEKEIKAHRANQNGQDVLKTLKTLREEGNVRVCPRCKTAYQKISGCDHIRCGKCGNDFHYNSTDQNQNGARQISEQESIVTRELSDFSIASASTQSSLPSYWRRLMKHMEN